MAEVHGQSCAPHRTVWRRFNCSDVGIHTEYEHRPCRATPVWNEQTLLSVKHVMEGHHTSVWSEHTSPWMGNQMIEVIYTSLWSEQTVQVIEGHLHISLERTNCTSD